MLALVAILLLGFLVKFHPVVHPTFLVPGGGFLLAPTASAPTLDILFPADADEWDELIDGLEMGLGAPSQSWLLNVASGNVTDSIGSVVLSALGTPGYEVASPQWPEYVGMSFAVNGNSRLQAGVPLWDASGSLWLSIAMTFGATLPGSLVTLLRGRNATSGIDVTQNTDGTITVTMDDQTTVQSLTTADSHAGESHLINVGRNVTSGRIYLCTGNEQIDLALTATGSLDSTEVGGVGRFATANIGCMVALAYWAGDAAEGNGVADWSAYAEHLGVA